MKKIIITILILLVTLAGCGEKTTPVTIDYNEIDNIKILIDLLPNPITEANREEVNTIKLRYEALKDEEKVLVTNIDTLNNAIEFLRIFDETEATRNRVFDDLQKYYEEYIPDAIEDDIILPETHETEIGTVRVMWGSNDVNTLTNKGLVIRGRKDIHIELTSTLIFENKRHSFKQDVTVKAMSFDPLPESRVAIAYVTSGTYKGLSETAIKTLDIINYAFANISNGKVNILGLSKLDQMLYMRKHGIRVLLCIGGYGAAAAPFSQAASTPQGRFELGKSIVDTIEKYHFDGVDIDWEYPGYYPGSSWSIDAEVDKENYNLLMSEIKRQVKKANPDYVVSAAVPGGPYFPKNYNMKGLNDILDYFNLMTYDLDARTTSTHLTALYTSSYTAGNVSVDQTVKLYTGPGYEINPKKLIIGAAFYGREYFLTSKGNIMKASATDSKSVPFSNIYTSYIQRTDGSVTRYWDDVAKAPYLYDSKNNITITYDDPESIKYKAQYAIDKGLAGMMYWEHTQDYNDTLISSIYENLVKNR